MKANVRSEEKRSDRGLLRAAGKGGVQTAKGMKNGISIRVPALFPSVYFSFRTPSFPVRPNLPPPPPPSPPPLLPRIFASFGATPVWPWDYQSSLLFFFFFQNGPAKWRERSTRDLSEASWRKCELDASLARAHVVMKLEYNRTNNKYVNTLRRTKPVNAKNNSDVSRGRSLYSRLRKYANHDYGFLLFPLWGGQWCKLN
jgi:hypothetical protein